MQRTCFEVFCVEAVIHSETPETQIHPQSTLSLSPFRYRTQKSYPTVDQLDIII